MPIYRSTIVALAAVATALVSGRSYGVPVTFNKDVAPIVYRHCVSCHRPGAVAPFSLLTFADVSKRAEQIEDVVVRKAMPPWKPVSEPGTFLNDRRMTDAEIELVRQWVADGAMEGNAADLPRPPTFSDGWQLGKPDLVLTMPEPIVVAADSRDLYMNVLLPLKVPPGKYLKATEFRPGNPRIVHHAVLFVDTSGQARKRDMASRGHGFSAVAPPGTYLPGALGMWTPGRNAQPLPDGLAMRWPADGVLVLNLHLHATGKLESEQSSIGFYFTSEPPNRQLVDLTLVDTTISIPAGDKTYRTHDRKVVPVDADVLTVFPHMHLIGRQIEVAAHLPDGTRQTLIRIDDWDYDWQDLYQFAKPVRLPAGTVVTLDAQYDNSNDNAKNPRNPPARVRWGEDAADEMSLAFLTLASIPPASSSRGGGKVLDVAAQQAAASWGPADADSDGRLSASEVVAAFGKKFSRSEAQQIIARFDRDGDRHLNFDEFTAALRVNARP